LLAGIVAGQQDVRKLGVLDAMEEQLMEEPLENPDMVTEPPSFLLVVQLLPFLFPASLSQLGCTAV